MSSIPKADARATLATRRNEKEIASVQSEREQKADDYASHAASVSSLSFRSVRGRSEDPKNSRKQSPQTFTVPSRGTFADSAPHEGQRS
jgi:hypothetical protein